MKELSFVRMSLRVHLLPSPPVVDQNMSILAHTADYVASETGSG